MRVFKLMLMVLFAFISLASCGKGNECSGLQCVEQAKLIMMVQLGPAEEKAKLGYAYYVGTPPFEKNKVEAAKWYEKAANLGNAEAQYNLGTMYDAGEGVPKDPAKAFYWFKQAAEQGDADSQFNLAHMYEKGEGVEKNRNLAIEWYTKAANQGKVEAAFNLGFIYMSDEPTNTELGEKLWARAANQSAKLQHEVAMKYLDGKYMKPNPQKGLDFLQKAALRGYGQSQVSLGLMYHEGFGIAKSEPDAYAWLSLANKSDGRIGERKDYVPQLLEVMTPEQISEGELKLQRLLLQVKPEKW